MDLFTHISIVSQVLAGNIPWIVIGVLALGDLLLLLAVTRES